MRRDPVEHFRALDALGMTGGRDVGAEPIGCIRSMSFLGKQFPRADLEPRQGSLELARLGLDQRGVSIRRRTSARPRRH